jgi:hypothetical protein
MTELASQRGDDCEPAPVFVVWPEVVSGIPLAGPGVGHLYTSPAVTGSHADGELASILVSAARHPQIVDEARRSAGSPLTIAVTRHVEWARMGRQVLEGEHHAAKGADGVFWPGQRDPVEPDPVRPACVELDLDQAVPGRRPDGRPQDRPVRAHPDHGSIGRNAVAGEGSGIVHRLDQVGLACAVGANERGDARANATSAVSLQRKSASASLVKCTLDPIRRPPATPRRAPVPLT